MRLFSHILASGGISGDSESIQAEPCVQLGERLFWLETHNQDEQWFWGEWLCITVTEPHINNSREKTDWLNRSGRAEPPTHTGLGAGFAAVAHTGWTQTTHNFCELRKACQKQSLVYLHLNDIYLISTTHQVTPVTSCDIMKTWRGQERHALRDMPSTSFSQGPAPSPSNNLFKILAYP